MALVTISGYPSSGKSTRALQLKKYFEEKISEPSYEGSLKTVVLISDDSLELTRDGYNGL